MEIENIKLYKNGDLVPESGTYQCIACGNQVYFKKGDLFSECDVCFSGTEDGPEEFGVDVEFWKFIKQ